MAYDIGPLEDGGRLGVKRLLALAAYLETIDDRTYDHRAWRGLGADRVMCALGHGATALPDLIGLRWRKPGCDDIVRLDGSGMTENPLILAAEAFELSPDEASQIFGVGLHTVNFYGPGGAFRLTPRAVAEAIRKFAYGKLAMETMAAA